MGTGSKAYKFFNVYMCCMFKSPREPNSFHQFKKANSKSVFSLDGLRGCVIDADKTKS